MHNVFEAAEEIKNEIEKRGITQEELAKERKCSQSYIANKLRLLKMSEEARQLSVYGKLSERHIRTVLRIADEEKQTLVIREMIRQNMNVANAEEFVDSIIDAQKSNDCRKILQNEARRIAENLKISGISVILTQIDGGVKLTIEE